MRYKKITKEELLKAVRKELGIKEEPESIKEFLEENRFATEKEFVKKAYRWVLKREADPEGLEHYFSMLRKRKFSRAGMVLRLCLSEEGMEKGVAVKEVEKVMKGVFKKSGIFKNRLLKIGLIKILEWKIKEEEKEEEEFISEFSEREEVLFMERFRGSPEKIKEHFKRRVFPLVKEVISRFDREKLKAIDLGCGRGEWLELLREEGIFCEGVELNRILVKDLIKKGFFVQRKDALEFLKSQEEESFHIVSGFHLIEHLPVEKRTRLLKEVYRVLKKGGIALFETPNPRNILVGAGDFYRDPSHLVPVFPDTFEFMGEIAGFEESIVFFYEEEGLIPAKKVRFDSLEDYLRVSRNYLWVGKKK